MTRQLFTLAVPETGPEARRWLKATRDTFDPSFAERVAPHFTLVFGSSPADETVYLEHVREVARHATPFSFACKRAVVGTDHQNESGYVFLVADEGNSSILSLRDTLHKGPFSDLLRLDIPYIPHITVGRFTSLNSAKQACDTINAAGIDIKGDIGSLTVVAMDNQGVIPEVMTIPLSSEP
jgi:2'-5' RNA ligase